MSIKAKTVCFILVWVLLFPINTIAEMNCLETVEGNYFKPALPTVDEDEILKIPGPLFDGGQVVCHLEFNTRSLDSNKRSRTEEGKLNGIAYRIFYSDGSGSIQGLETNTLKGLNDKYGTNWHTRCEIDEMDDTAWCSIDRGDITFAIWKDGTTYIRIGYNHYPGTDVVIRIDKNKPIKAKAKEGFSSEQTTEIFNQMKSSSKVLTRYQEWPRQSNKDDSFVPYGFKEAWEILNTVYKNLSISK